MTNDVAELVALLRGINVGGHRRVPMVELRALASALGFANVRTYLASGNLLFDASASTEVAESMLERAVADRFGFAVDVIVRSAAHWANYQQGNPLAAESVRQPNLVMLCLGKRAGTDEDVERLRSRAAENERVERRGDALWLYFGAGVARSRMANNPGSGVWTTRNWNSVAAIGNLLEH